MNTPFRPERLESNPDNAEEGHRIPIVIRDCKKSDKRETASEQQSSDLKSARLAVLMCKLSIPCTSVMEK